MRQFYRLAAGSPLLTSSSIIAFQPFGDFLRANAHWHALVLEGGFSPDGQFLFLPLRRLLASFPARWASLCPVSVSPRSGGKSLLEASSHQSVSHHHLAVAHRGRDSPLDSPYMDIPARSRLRGEGRQSAGPVRGTLGRTAARSH